jgi:site-specific DNA recombinase
MISMDDKMSEFKITPEMNAAIYARKSTKMDNHSIESQISLGKKLIEKNNLLLYNIYFDEETATKYHPLHRPGFRRLLYDLEDGKFKTLVVYRRDRLARKVEDLIEIRKKARQYNVKIIYSNEGEYQTSNSYMSDFIENIIIAVDELEPKILSERIASGKKEKRLRGEYSGRKPFGYDPNWSDYKPVTDMKALLENIFKIYVSLDMESYKKGTFIKEINSTPPGFKLSKSKIESIIKNPVYAGIMLKNSHTSYKDILESKSRPQDNSNEIDEEYFVECVNVVGVIDIPTWYKALDNLGKFTDKLTSSVDDIAEYLLKGLLRCSKCSGIIKLIDNDYKCSKGCFTCKEDEVIKKVLSAIIVFLLSDKQVKLNIHNKLGKVKKDISRHKLVLKELNNKKEVTLNELISQKSLENMTLKNNLQEMLENRFIIENNIDVLKDRKILLDSISESLDEIIKIVDTDSIIAFFKRNKDRVQDLLSTTIEKVIVDEEYPTSPRIVSRK